MIALDTLLSKKRYNRFKAHVLGAFDPESAPEEWEPGPYFPFPDTMDVSRRGNFWTNRGHLRAKPRSTPNLDMSRRDRGLDWTRKRRIRNQRLKARQQSAA